MRIGIGIGMGFGHGGGGAFALSNAQWTVIERPEDANTRQLQIDIYRDPPAGFKYVWYRGKAAFAVPTSGNFGATTDLGGAHWQGLAAGKTTMGTVDLVRVFLAPVGLSDPVAWNADGVIPCVPVAEIKEFSPSSIPDQPIIASYAPDGTGGADITFEAAVTNGRTVTGGSYRVGTSGSYTTFTGLTLNVPVIADGQTLQVYWTNVNGNGAVLSQILYLIAEPPPPEARYTIDGSGAAATVLLSAPEGFETTGLTGARWRIDGGSWTEQAEIFEIALTGLSGTPAVGVAWGNAAGWSDTTTFTLVVSPPTYTDFTVVDAVAESGDELTLTLGTAPTVPDGLALLGVEYTIDGGVTSAPVVTSLTGLATGVAVDVQTRIIYDVGPSPWSAPVSATPTYPPVVTEFPLDSGWFTHNTTSTNVSSLNANLTPDRAPGKIIFAFVAMDDVVTMTATKDPRAANEWVVNSEGSATHGTLYAIYKVCEYSDEVVTLTPSSSQQMIVKSKAIEGARFADIVRGSQVLGIDPAAISWADTEKALLLTAICEGGEDATITAAPSGWDTLDLSTSAANSGGVRLAVSSLDSESTGVNPGPWTGGNASFARVVTYAFLPDASVPPVTMVNVELSATTIDNGESITWTAEADGRAPKTFTLEVDGNIYSNSTGIFTVSPSTAASGWTLTAENAAGSAFDAGTITVLEGIILTVSVESVLEIVVEADSVTHSVTAASYELEVQTAAGAAISLLAQSGPDFSVTFAENGAYRFRPIAVAAGGARSYGDWFYYAAFVQGGISWAFENAQAAQISPLSAQAPIEVVPVSGRQVKIHEPRPAHYTETAGGRTHHLNGVMFNPSAAAGRGPHAWDSRTIYYGELSAYMGKFDLTKLHTVWPQKSGIGGTVSKFLSRPTLDMPSVNEAHRRGLANQQGGLIIKSALSTTSPMQAAPALIKHDGWLEQSTDLPGYGDVIDQIIAWNLSAAGMSVPDVVAMVAKISRLDVSTKLLRGATHYNDHGEAFKPYGMAINAVSNYNSFSLDNALACIALSDAATSDQKLLIVNHLILRGLQCDFPGNSFRTGAGISQYNLLSGGLARLARGVDMLDLGATQVDNAPWSYGYWTTERLGYLAPHDSNTLPLFARRRQVTTVLADTGTGHQLVFPWALGTTGERQQDFNGLMLVRELTGEVLPYVGGTGQKPGPTETFGTVGFYSGAALSAGEWFYLKIPDAVFAASFVEGEPFWMHDSSVGGSPPSWMWYSFNPVPGMTYRDINEPQGSLLMLHALGGYPDVPGSNFNAMKDYTIKTKTGTWPASGWAYPFTAGTFVTQFWTAHAATLGITL